jgi:FdrA protein
LIASLEILVRAGTYVDSVSLMRISEELRGLPGVLSAAVVMATEANRRLLTDTAMWPPGVGAAGPTDLLAAVKAETPEAARAALGHVEQLLATLRGSTPGAEAPRSTRSAARAAPGANLGVVAVPAPHAAVDAHQALSAGLHVFLFSDGVSIADEIALKRRAHDRHLLVMGPECGTSILNGVGLGFANRVRRGPIGIVGASGTGIQEVTCLVDRFGAGVSHAIGTGGRDLYDGVDGMTTLQALELLAHDPETRVIVILSKPASTRVADAVLAAAVKTGKPVVACLFGWAGAVPEGVRTVATLEDAARVAVATVGIDVVELVRPRPPGSRAGTVHGLYSGGTLCEEARRIVGGTGRFIDFGAAEFTRGRPHPMIDPGLRGDAIAAAGDDERAVVLLMDVVLGYCAHPDPAGALLPALVEARARARDRGRDLALVVHVVGTEADPQSLSRQENTLRALGAIACPSNRIAAEVARDVAR